MENLKFYSANEVYAETYYQLPKIFFTNEKYKKMNSDTKIAYALLKDRFNYSIRNNWCDKDNHIYFIYTIKELQEILNCGTEKVTKIKKELEKVGLLFQKRIGLNQPNRLYLLKPQANAQDVYLQQENYNELPATIDNKGFSKIEIPKEPSSSLDNKGFSKIEIPEKPSSSFDNKGFSKIENNQYKEQVNIDTYIDTIIDTKKDPKQNQVLLDSFSITQDQSFLDKRCLELIALFSSTIQEAHKAIGIIIRAKNKQEKKYGRVLIAEDWQEEIEHTLRKVYHKIKTDSTIKNRDNYMFGAFCTTFDHCFLELLTWENKQKKDTPVISTYDWVEQRENK